MSRIDILSDRANRIQERQLNQSSYVFAVASTIFLPLNFVTGLFGANLLGLPFADATNGFWGVGRSLLTNECWVGSGLSLVQMALVDGLWDCLRCIC